MGDVGRWLEERGLGQYAEVFEANDVTAEVLPELTDADLRELGLSLGHRRLLLKAIKATAEGASAEHEAVAPDPTPPMSTPETRQPRHEPERRQLTVLFCDLVGSTALSATLDPEDLGEVMRAYQSACASVIARWDGHLAKYLGDGVLAYFGWPRAHEDDAERAIRAGLGLVRATAELQEPGGRPLAARVGIATGLVVVGDLIGDGAAQEEAVVGDTPNLAARLQALAAPGQVVIAEATRRLAGGGFELTDLGVQILKGIAEPVPVLAVTGERSTPSRFEARAGPALLPMVGREQELALLLGRWALAKAGEGQGVLLTGEAGIGKSRIVRALMDALAEEPHTRVRYQCSPHHSDSALWPVIQHLARASGIVADDPTDTSLDKLEALLAGAGEVDADAAPRIARLLGLEGDQRYGPLDLAPQAQRARTMDQLIAQMLGLAAQEPVLVVLEDAHWVDPTTLELMEQCLDRIADARVMIVVTSRPDHRPELAGHPHVTRLTLTRLGRGGVEAIVAGLSEGSALPAEVVEAIVARTDGVPLFVEELTRAILDTGDATVPSSLHDSLMARLDRIPEVKEVAQIAACIGREFPFALLAAVGDRPEPELVTALDQLAAAELIFRRGTPPDATYSFKHALVHDVAYESLLKRRRQQLHACIFEALDEEPVGVPPGVLALHAQRAGLWRRAVDGCTWAAREAAERWAMREAAVLYERAIQSLGSMPDDQRSPEEAIDLRLELNNVMWRASLLAGMAENLALAEETARRIGDQRRLASVLIAASRHYMTMGQPEDALRVSEQILEVGGALQDLLLMAMANCRIGMSYHFLDHNRRAIQPLRATLDFLEGEKRFERFGQPGALSIVAGSFLVYAHAWLGEFEAASAEGQSALEIAEAIGHPYEISFAAAAYGFALRYRGDHETALTVSRRGIEVCEGKDVTIWIARLYANLAVALVHSGDLAGATEIAGRVTPHSPYDRAFFACAMAEVFLRSADGAAAMAWSEQALTAATKARSRAFGAQARRLVVAAGSRHGEMSAKTAQTDLQEMIDEADQLGLRAEAVRAQLALARLWAEQGRRTEACDLLALLCGWFTEGFDLPDLKEAKELLEELR